MVPCHYYTPSSKNERPGHLPANVYYYFTDGLGSSRVITTSTGTVCYDADFYPFGGERSYTNSCAQNYKFTGKERDSESGLDDFGARGMSSQYGRFMTPDWAAQTEPVPYAKLDDPQSLNLYSYVENNPLGGVDPDGHACSPLLRNTNSGFCKRATEYGIFDANSTVRALTRFYAAASAASQALADVAAPGILRWPFVSAQTAKFLENVGQDLAKLNSFIEASIRDGLLTGPDLDARLVHLEQTEVEGQLNTLRLSDQDAYDNAITEINRTLNHGKLRDIAFGRFDTDIAYDQVLDEVRNSLGRNIDFSNQGDREAIGNGLINHIQTKGGCDMTGNMVSGC